jgi:DNA invertase Pin-like site-specific DNA recombinase
MYIGYARVSTHEQNLTLQQDALTHAGCKKMGSSANGIKLSPKQSRNREVVEL